jgi:ABC-type antimicrobial peptide transport system permease subunit
MFVTYLVRELRRRMRQACFIALGLAVGIGLVITVTAASAGVKNAQSTVLHSLYGVGTDITVTTAPSQGSGGPFGFRVRGQGATSGARPKAGQKFSRNVLVTGALGTLKSSSVTTIAQTQNVTAAAGALSATDLSISGKIPTTSDSNGGGGLGGGGASGGGGGGGPTSIKTSTFAVLGVDTGAGRVGPLSSDKIASGRTFTAAEADSNVALLDANYARQHKLATGSKITVGSAKFTVIGTVAEPQGGTTTDVYIPLQRAQSMAGMSGKVNTIYVAAASATDITAVQQAIKAQIPKATVTTSSDLASQVTGSLSNASSLAGTLGKWLAIVVLIAAFAMASLLTMAAVSRRVREFGTLKALGWRSRRIVGQVMGETLVIGVVGGAAGIALGFAGAALVKALVPPLSATLGQSQGSASPGFGPPGGGGGRLGGGGAFGRSASDAAKTVLVHLDTPVTISIIVLAVLLAVAGGLIAGMFGGWRAARLRPAAALAQVQ